MEELVNLINQVAFPIVACIYIFNNNKELIAVINKLSVTLEGFGVRLEMIERNQENEYNSKETNRQK